MVGLDKFKNYFAFISRINSNIPDFVTRKIRQMNECYISQRKMLVLVNGNKFKIDRQQHNRTSNFVSANSLIAKFIKCDASSITYLCVNASGQIWHILLYVLLNFERCLYQNEHYETEIVLNSNLMIPDFPHNIKIRLAPLKRFLVAS